MPIQTLEELQELIAEAQSDSVAVDMMNQAAYEIRYTNPGLVRQIGEQAHTRSQAIRYTRGLAESSKNIGVSQALMGEHTLALQTFGQALELYDQLEDRTGITTTTAALAGVHQLLGDFDTALELHEKVLEIERRASSPELRANTLYNMGLIFLQTDRPTEGQRVLRESLSIKSVIDDKPGITLALSCLGEAHRMLGELTEAEEILNRSLAHARKYHHDFLLSQLNLYRTHLFIDLGRFEEANALISSNEKTQKATNNRPYLADSYLMRARLAWAQEQVEQALGYIRECIKLADELRLDLLRREAFRLEVEIHEVRGNGMARALVGVEKEAATENGQKPPESGTLHPVLGEPSATSSLLPLEDLPAIYFPPTTDAVLASILATFRMNPKLSVDLLNATWRLRLPTVEQLRRRLPESFVYHLPLPGPCTDFYIQAEREDALYLGIANAPGEGIEISLFTQLAYEYLATLMYHPAYTSPAEILNAFQEYIRPAMDHPGWNDVPEMRLAVVKVDQAKGEIYVSGAGLSMIWKGQGTWEELPIGHAPLRGGESSVSFNDMELDGQKGNQIFLSTDGYSRLAAVAEMPPLIQQLKDIQSYDFSLKAPVLKSIIEKALKQVAAPDDILILGAGL